MEKTQISETYHAKMYDGRSYDTKIPNELVDIFMKLKETLIELSGGKYECTPLVYDVNEESGVSCGIIEIKEKHSTKLPFYLSIK